MPLCTRTVWVVPSFKLKPLPGLKSRLVYSLLAPSLWPRRRLRRLFHFSQHAGLSPCHSRSAAMPCASARSQRRCGLRPHRRLRRLSARPTRPAAALRCPRIRLHPMAGESAAAMTTLPRANDMRTDLYIIGARLAICSRRRAFDSPERTGPPPAPSKSNGDWVHQGGFLHLTHLVRNSKMNQKTKKSSSRL